MLSGADRGVSFERHCHRLLSRAVYLVKHRQGVVFLCVFSALALLLFLGHDHSRLGDSTPVTLYNRLGEVRNTIESREVGPGLYEYPRGPARAVKGTIDNAHLHGRYGYDLVTGEPIWRPEPLTFRMSRPQKEEAHRGYCFNSRVSRSLPLDRLLPDLVEPECRRFDYNKALTEFSKGKRKHLQKADVIIVFHNEDLSVLLRSVASVLDRTPTDLLGEVILLNDDSNATTHTWLFDELPRMVRTMPKTRLFHSTERLGLMMARVKATKAAGSSPTVVYLDSHVECQKKWLEPLLLEIAYDRRTIVTPMIHTIDADTFSFEKNALGVLSFSWSLGQTHPHPGLRVDQLNDTLPLDDPIRQTVEPVRRYKSPLPPMVSPVMAGGLFAADRKFFIEDLEGYDEEMKLYGGEEMEIGFKAWMCHGQLLNIPCSHIGHVFRTDEYWKGQVYKVPSEEISRNKRRVAEVWMDEYLPIYDEVAPAAAEEPLKRGGINLTLNDDKISESETIHYREHKPGDPLPVGDLTKQRALRDRLQCKSFKWFLETVATDVWVPNLARARRGAVFNAKSKLCMDNMQSHAWGYAGLYHCHGHKGSQAVMLDQGLLRFGGNGFKLCLIPTTPDKLQLQPCGATTSESQWVFEPQPDKKFERMFSDRGDSVAVGLLKFGDKCLSMRRAAGPYLVECDVNDPYQSIGWSKV